MATQDASDAGAHVMLDALGPIFVGLSSTPPTKAGTNITPPTGDYVRFNGAFAAAASRKRQATVLMNFVSGGGAAAASQGTFGWATYHSAVSGGTFYLSTQLTQALAWTAGAPVTMAAADVSVEFETT